MVSRVSSTMRIGTGAGFSADRLDAAVDLARRGNLDVLVLECLGERTVASAHRDRRLDPTKGYNQYLERRMRALLEPCKRSGTTLVTNMGAANPSAAAERTLQVARSLGISGLRIACIGGDEVTGRIPDTTPLMDEAGTLVDVGLPVLGINAYLGVDAILPALEAGADVIIGGRLADPSMFLAPLVWHFGWNPDDLDRMAGGTLVGHLLECGMQVSGGYFADPGFKHVDQLATCGYPIADVTDTAEAIISKLPGTGGLISPATVKEQLLYEVHDPAGYLTPDVTADFSRVAIAAMGADRVKVSGARGKPRPDRLKATVGLDAGYLAEAGLSYAGPGAVNRARLAGEIVRERLQAVHACAAEFRVDCIGSTSLFATAVPPDDRGEDVRLHVALRSRSRADAEALLWEVEALLCCGPAGGGGYRGSITPSVISKSVLIDRALVQPSVEVLIA